MKIGILTFHRAHNYGAVLQAYALQGFLALNNLHSEIIDYRPEYIESPYRLFPIESFKAANPMAFPRSIASSILFLYQRIPRRKHFKQFYDKYLNVSNQKYKQVSSFPKDYDVYLFGSDQIWNPDITRGFDPAYFGQFPKNSGSKLIAYAASMAAKKLSPQEEKFYSKALEEFDFIGVREIELRHLLQPITTKHVEVVLDPTLLLAPSEFNEILVEPKIKQKYVLIYEVRKVKVTEEIAKNIAIQLGAKVIRVAAKAGWGGGCETIFDASPGEFLGLIKNAACVVTSSFHGMTLSIAYNRPFYAVLPDRYSSRTESFLSQLDLTSRCVSTSSITFSDVEYPIVQESIKKLRGESIHALLSALTPATEATNP